MSSNQVKRSRQEGRKPFEVLKRVGLKIYEILYPEKRKQKHLLRAWEKRKQPSFHCLTTGTSGFCFWC